VDQHFNNSPERLNKRIHVALPIRVTYWDEQCKPGLQMACTYDISPRGARLGGLHAVQRVGDVIAVERGRSGKAFCRVIWIGEADSELRGQIGIECVEPKRTLWEAELGEMDELFDRLGLGANTSRVEFSPGGIRSTRRRRPRFPLEGLAELLNPELNLRWQAAGLKNLSEMGCLVSTEHALSPGAHLKLVLNIADYDLTLKGQVRHVAQGTGLGIEFSEIRKGDRQVLQFLLRKLAEQEYEENFQLEVG
jgi:hypothetical protein